MTTTKTLDCVAMKRKGARRIYQQIRGMSLAEELAFWHQRGSRLDRRIKLAKRKLKSPSRAGNR